MTKPRTVAVVIIALSSGYSDAADILQLSNDTTVVVSADDSWEEAEQDILHFRGNFEIRTPRWTVMADQATVYGKLDTPKRVVADGSPVQFFFRNTENHSTGEGESRHLEYAREPELLKLSGNVKLTTRGRVMQSSEVQYDVERQKLLAGGPEGVHITVYPDE